MLLNLQLGERFIDDPDRRTQLGDWLIFPATK